MQLTEANWSETEKNVAKNAFNKAYKREVNALITLVREKSGEITELDQLWQLHDFLSARRHDIEGKYDFNYSMIIFVFAQLFKEGWVKLDDLQGLNKDKLSKITSLAKMT